MAFTINGRCTRRKVVVFGVLLVLLVVKWLIVHNKDRMIADKHIITALEEVYMPYEVSDHGPSHSSDLPLIYFVTPTGVRTEQKADLTRLSHTLRLVPRLHWIVIEDRLNKSKLVGNLLANCKVPYTHLAVQTNQTYLEIRKSSPFLPRGVDQRNAGLDWIAQHGEYPSVFYPGDDDNAYDLQLFEEMRYTQKVAVWPVGLICHAKFSTPIVQHGKVIDWAAGWGRKRKFVVDMAGFSVNTQLLRGPKSPRFHKDVQFGYVETNFIEQLNITMGDLEPKADNCTKVLVWHTRTEKTQEDKTAEMRRLIKKFNVDYPEI